MKKIWLSILAASLLLMLTGCGPLATFRLSGDITMNVYSAETDENSWKVELDFERDAAAPELDLIQRAHLIDGRTVVETFKFRRWYFGKTTTDHHFMGGLTDSDSRYMVVVLGTSEGADWTSSGFAMLTSIKDSAYVTKVDDLFNESYRKKHTIRGTATQAPGRPAAVWRIAWAPNRLRISTASGELLLEDGAILTLEIEGITLD